MPTSIDNLKSQMRKGMLEFCVLLLLRQGDAYASEMIGRLKNDGLLSYRWEESTQGPPRKYYSITPLGHSFLEQLTLSWNDIARSVNILLNQTDITE